MAAAIEQWVSVGRRKCSVARVYLRPGRGKITINGQTPEEYFGKRAGYDEILKWPLKETHTVSKYDLVINVNGGGVRGQIDAIRHGISRSLQLANPEFRPVLKSLGFLRRDSREKERRKYGLAKARKAYQFSKR